MQYSYLGISNQVTIIMQGKFNRENKCWILLWIVLLYLRSLTLATLQMCYFRKTLIYDFVIPNHINSYLIFIYVPTFNYVTYLLIRKLKQRSVLKLSLSLFKIFTFNNFPYSFYGII